MTRFTIGGVHEFCDRALVREQGKRGLDADGVIQLLEEWIKFVLNRAGIEELPNTGVGLVDLASKFPLDSVERLALGMLEKIMQLSGPRPLMIRRGLPDEIFNEVFNVGFELGMNYSALMDIERGISADTVYGRKTKSERSSGAALGNAIKASTKRRKMAQVIEWAKKEIEMAEPDRVWTVQSLAEQTLIGSPSMGLDWVPKISTIRGYLKEAVERGLISLS